MPLDIKEIQRVSDPYVHGKPQTHYNEKAIPLFVTTGSIKVHLLVEPEHTHHEERDWIYRAYQIAMSTWTNHEIDPADYNEMVSVLKYEYSKGAATIPLEAMHLTFSIEGVPRATTHQLVRHRKGGYGQESLRVTDVRRHGFRLPDSVLMSDSEDIFEIYTEAVKKSFEAYATLVDAGIPHEDARLLIGMGLITYITTTMDLRTFIDYIFARTQDGALDEHKIVAVKMFEEFKKAYPIIYDILKERFPKNKYLNNLQ